MIAEWRLSRGQGPGADRQLGRGGARGNGVKYGLSSSLFTNDIGLAFRSIRDFDTGLGYVNHGTIGAEAHLPFGGTKATGNGHREVGQASLDFFSEWKSVYIDYSGKLQRAQIDMTFIDEG